jgi:hypothetical protein
MLSKVAKLDIAIAFATYIFRQQVPMAKPIILDESQDTYTRLSAPCVFMQGGLNPLLLEA